MDEQLSLFSDLPAGRAREAPPLPGFTDLAPELADEVAAVWGLPVGRRARVTLCGHVVDELSGLLQIAGLPELPLDARRVLRLRIGHLEFTSRQVTGWSALE
jgi:hypothetical protein